MLATKKQVENALDLEDKNRDKILKKLSFCLSYFLGKMYFDDKGSQNYLIFQSFFKYFQIFSGTIHNAFGWKS